MTPHERHTEPLLHVVLVRPEIPNNAGNIGRTCMATGCALHLVHPMAFDTDEKAVRRAGMDYWHELDVREHASLDAYLYAHDGARLWLTSGLPDLGTPHWDATFERGDHILFGTESAGLPEELLRAHAERVVRLPMVAGVRGLNVASCVSAVLYEALRQLVAREPGLVDQHATITHRASISGVWRSGDNA
ncbi:MAG: tRNA (cytidine(34)-2'-O)-methyltransferase [Phycisphaerales bacterium]